LAEAALYGFFDASDGNTKRLHMQKRHRLMAVAFRGEAVPVIRSGGDQDWQIQRDLRDSGIQRRARFGFTAATAIGAAGAGLQFGEMTNTIGSGATDVVIGDGVA
jgi:hypothetical protein